MLQLYCMGRVRAVQVVAVMPYTVKLSSFEGPLDLLLRLIESAQVSIRDIFISQITEQFIDAVSNAEDFYMDSVSEFLSMAALLLELKARSLLPPPLRAPDDEEASEALFFRNLEEYKRIRESIAPLKTLEGIALHVYARLPGEMADGRLELLGASREMLTEAFYNVLARVSQERAAHIAIIDREPFTVEQGALHILSLLRERGRMAFTDLLDGAATCSDVITLFLSLLELMREGIANAVQERPMDVISLSMRGNPRVEA